MQQSDESKLPARIRENAVLSGLEFGWRRDDIFDAIEAASTVGLASLGGQVQFRFSDGTCEMYWLNFDPADRETGEPWQAYVERSCSETAVALRKLLATTDLLAEARRSFEFVRIKEAEGLKLDEHLVFLCYFKSEDSRDAS
jgi:hypothetical protein